MSLFPFKREEFKVVSLIANNGDRSLGGGCFEEYWNSNDIIDSYYKALNKHTHNLLINKVKGLRDELLGRRHD